MWSELNFGKHKGKTLPQVLFTDPDWFFWACEESIFDKRVYIKPQVNDIYSKARNIKIPVSCGTDMVVEYYIHHPTGKFSHFVVVPQNRPQHESSSPSFRSEIIDMSVPRQIARYDKLGCKQLLESLKYYVFGNKSTRMTKQKCEAFFNETSNFG